MVSMALSSATRQSKRNNGEMWPCAGTYSLWLGLLYFTAFDAFGYSIEEKDSMTMATF